MAKYLRNNNGNITEEATLTVSAGAASAAKIPELDGTGRLDQSFMPAGLVPETISTTAGEALSAGDFVYFDSTGKALRATAGAVTTQAQGFVLTAAALSAAVVVYNVSGVNSALTGLTPGQSYFLSGTTPGAAVLSGALPTGTGKIVQRLGFAVTATNLQVGIQQPIVLA